LVYSFYFANKRIYCHDKDDDIFENGTILEGLKIGFVFGVCSVLQVNCKCPSVINSMGNKFLF